MVTDAEKTRNSGDQTQGQTHDVEKNPQLSDSDSTRPGVLSIANSKVGLNGSESSPQPGSSTQDLLRKRLTSDQRLLRQNRLPEVHGTRLKLLVTCLFVSLLVSTIEQFVVGVALADISSELDSYDMSSWVVTAYLASYNSFLMVFARASDIFGRRTTFQVALIIFSAASLGCGLSNSMTQLIVFRAFQGVGGAGLYTLTLNVATEIPGAARKTVNVLVPVAFGLGSGTAPLIGGAIVTNTTWRWVFLFNVPVGCVVFLIAYFVFPKNAVKIKYKFSDILRIDWLGVVLLIGSVEMLTFALQEGGTRYAWNSSQIICIIVFAAVLWFSFFTWQYYLTQNEDRFQMLPLWPSRLWNGRVKAFSMIAAFFCGFPLFSAYIYLPQRFEIVDGLTPLIAGACLLPMPIISFWATGITSTVCLSKNLSWYCFITGAALQAIGLGLLSTVGIDHPGKLPSSIYVYEIITGIGIGTCLSAIALVVRSESSYFDHSVSMSATSALRTIGGTISIAIGHIVVADRITSPDSGLAGLLTSAQIESVSQDPTSLRGFTTEQSLLVRQALVIAFKTLWQAMCGFALGAFLFGTLCWVRKPVDLKEMDNREQEEKKRLEATWNENDSAS